MTLRVGPQQAHREAIATRGRLYFEFRCRWTLRSVRHGDVLFYCYVARNRDIRTIPTWGSYERFEFFLCPHFLAKSFRAIGIGQGISHTLVSGLHVGLHNSAIPAGFRQDFLPCVLVDTKWIHIVRSMARP
jgi:hypothetical protein